MTDAPVLRIDDGGRVRTLTLDRPDARNAFNADLYFAMRDALVEAAADPAVSVCLITGAGDVFSAGQDLKMLADFSELDAPPESGFGPFARGLAAFDKPLLAAVNGAAVGVGSTLLLHCDVVFVSDRARFRFPFVSLGLVPEAASSVLLPARIGPQAASHYLLTGEWMDASTAVERGLAWKVCTPETLLAEATAAARSMAAAGSMEALRASKRLLLAGRADAVNVANDRELAELDRIVREILKPSA